MKNLMNEPLHAFVLVALIAMTVSTVCRAAEDSFGRVPSLGDYAIGTPFKSLKGVKAADGCEIDAKKDYASCVFSDGNGVEYFVEGDRVYSIVVRAANTNSSVHLPFGLAFGDKLGTALDKVTALKQVSWAVTRLSDDETVVHSLSQFGDSGPYTFGIELVFKENKLDRLRYGTDGV